jgi:hypothetical protein
MPPTRTIERMEAPPDSASPTSAQLKGDIDSGRTGDKIGVFDPGLSPLGTDDEAAGTPNEPHRVRLARHFESVKRWAAGARPQRTSHEASDGALSLYIGAIALIGTVLVAGVVWLT